MDEADPDPEIYTVIIEPSEHGTVASDKANATQGETVILTAEADDGYHLAGFRVVEASSNNCQTFEVYDTATGDFVVYGFAMPASDVNVSAVFSRDEDEGYAVVTPTRRHCGSQSDSRGAGRDHHLHR